MVAETCKCSEDLKKDFYDFAYHGLRAEHNELVHRVEDLVSALPEMSEEEKKDFEKLHRYQVNRQRQVGGLDKLWKGLFSPVCYTLICIRTPFFFFSKTANFPLTDTLASGQLYLRTPQFSNPRFTSQSNSVFAHSRKRTLSRKRTRTLLKMKIAFFFCLRSLVSGHPMYNN